MSFIESIILGLVQGLTEFFPVSSSAHLKLTKMLMGISLDEKSALFDLSCHLGTLGALIWYMRKDLLELFTKERSTLRLYFWALLPLIPAYFLLKPVREFLSQPAFLGLFLSITGIILFIGQKWRLPLPKKNTLRDVFWIGTLQSAALIPGLSRSASTISCAQVLGWSAEQAVRFSFLLSIPTILGGMSLEIVRQMASQAVAATHESFLSCSSGFLAAFISGTLVIGFALKCLQRGKLSAFAWYCLCLGIATTLILNS